MTKYMIKDKFKLILVFIAGLLIGGSGATYSCYMLFWDSHALEEIKIAHAYLNSSNDKLSPQLKEYLKGRLYWNMNQWMRYRDDFFIGSMHPDFGPIETDKLNGISGIKDSTPPDEIYHDAMMKFNINVNAEQKP